MYITVTSFNLDSWLIGHFLNQLLLSFDEVTLDDNFLLTNETRHGRREKRQVRYR